MSEEINKEEQINSKEEQTSLDSENKQKQINKESEKSLEEESTKVDENEKFASLDEEFKAIMEAKVTQAEEKAKEAEDKFLRTHADFENIKKRLEKEKYQAIDFASEKFAKDLLAPIDALLMAQISANGDFDPQTVVEKLKEGIDLTIKSFNAAFEKHDIFEVEYDVFNPEYHNAVMQVDSDEIQSGQIVTVMQKGYTLKNRLLREAMVSVAN
jgi:molecular chaperone GrpE